MPRASRTAFACLLLALAATIAVYTQAAAGGPALAEPGTRVAVRVLDRFVGGVVASEPRWDPRGERLRA